jgi:phosphate transport system permease protein
MTATTNTPSRAVERIKNEESFLSGLRNRHLQGTIWKYFFQAAIVIGIVALLTLMFNVVNRIVGLVAVREIVDPATLADGRDLESLSAEELARIYSEYRLTGANTDGGRVFLRDNVIGRDTFQANPQAPMSQLLPNADLPPEVGALTFSELQPADTQVILAAAAGQITLLDAVITEIVGREILEAWTFTESTFNRAAIEERVASNEDWAGAQLEWRSWLNPQFLTTRMTTIAADSGVRAALLGSLVTIALTVLIAFPLGVGTAIYLEEYSTGNSWFENFIETNIRNLAGVPSIIYGLLGLAIFVRALASITQGRTIISAALTMALLILPVIIINAQEALRAVPPSIREASFGLGATRWQTIWNQVLPAAMPGILTGTILGMSRAIGETAPLIIIGAATFIATDPGLTSRFTVLPIQIYTWTKDPRQGFSEIAAATIVLLLIVLLLFNATAIILRQRFRRKLSG